jgi:hypothetical protein
MSPEPLESSPPSVQLRVKLEDGNLEIILRISRTIRLPDKRLENI